MDSGLGAEVINSSEDGVIEKGDPTALVDTCVNRIGEASSLLYDAEGVFVHEDASLNREVSSTENDGMDVDSESTYSCLNSSSEEKCVDSDGKHELTSQDDRLNKDAECEFRSPKTCIISNTNGSDIEGKQDDCTAGNSSDDQQGMDTDDKEVSISEDPSNASSASFQVVNDEDYEYIVPKLGAEFESEEHAHKCYSRYALMEGFSIRKDFVNKSKVSGLVVSRRYTCHRQGYGSSKRDMNTKPRKDTRTGCLAHMTITRQTNGKYRVIHFETRHNHEFVTPFTAHLLPSQKRISFVEAVETESDVTPLPDGVPKMGMGFDSEIHAYEFYNAYAGRVGFSIRKDYVNRSKKDGAVASRRYTCFREGYRQNDKRGLKVKRPRKETRVGCMAQLVISRQPDGRYRVTHFEECHNHELAPACKVRTLRSQKRSLTNQNVESSASGVSDMSPKSLTGLLLTGIRVHDDPSFDPIDHEMSLSSKRMGNMKQEEAENFHQYFQSKKLKDPSFVYAVQLDVEEEMTNFFWADEKMLADYGDFGDVVCFDTTYRLNKDWRPVVLFFGINNHKQILVFGAGFLYDDTAQSVKWLLRTFIRAMSGKMPKTVLSEHDAMISEIISSELPGTQHRLCTWQIYQNALKHLSEVVVSSDSFSSDLCGCFLHPDEEEFVNSWKLMLDTYSLWDNEWLHVIFEEREKWALPYSKHVFSADIETVLLSEGSISSPKKYLKKESHILQFVKHFGRVVNDWRYKELEVNYDMGQHMPRLMGDVIMLKQVREIYTPIIFKAFHQEYEHYLNIVIDQCIDAVSSVEYKVSTYGEVRHHTVLYGLEDDLVACSCMKFESVGILCSHGLKVLDYRNIKIVPSRYILKRWTRDARA